MRITDCLTIAISNIFKKKIRSLLTVLSISVGIATVVFITTAGNSGINSINGEMSKMGLNCSVIKAREGYIGKKDIIKAQNILGGENYVSTVVKAMCDLSANSRDIGCIMYGGDEEIISIFNRKIVYGRNIRINDLINEKKVVIIDTATSKKLFDTENSVGRKVEISFGTSIKDFVIAGVTDSSLILGNSELDIPTVVFAPYTSLKTDFGIYLIPEIYTLSRDGEICEKRVISAVRHINSSKRGGSELYAEGLNIYKNNIDSVAATITLILSLIGAISLISGGIGVINIMFITVTERKEEIGVRKALGQTDISIIVGLISEAVIIMIAACIFGIAAGFLISGFALKFYGILYIPDLRAAAIVTGVSFVMGIVSGFIPACKIFKMNPVEILK